MQHIDVARRTFRVERPLHQKRAEMAARTKTSHASTLDKAQLQVCAPACIMFRLFDALRQQHPIAPDIHGLVAVKRITAAH
ncbi:hypothetical protein D3C79_853460 [compost metagenome]